MKTTTTGLTYQLFVGFPLSSELRIQLIRSHAWKESQIINPNGEKTLRQVHFEDKDFLGRYLPKAELSMNDLAALETSLRDELHALCPQYKQEKLPIRIFSQTFIS